MTDKLGQPDGVLRLGGFGPAGAICAARAPVRTELQAAESGCAAARPPPSSGRDRRRRAGCPALALRSLMPRSPPHHSRHQRSSWLALAAVGGMGCVLARATAMGYLNHKKHNLVQDGA